MECSTVEADIDETCTLLSSSRPTARKDHKCYECRKTISKGTSYLKEVIVFDRELTSYKLCPVCESIRNTFFTEGWYYGQLMNMLYDHISDCETISEDVILKLIPEAQSLVLKMMEEK